MLSLQITSEEDEEGERGGGRERGLRGAERGGGRERGLRETEREGGRRRRGSLSSLDAKEAMSEPENVHHHYGGMCLMRNPLTLSKPRAYICIYAQSLHKSIRLYMAIILGININFCLFKEICTHGVQRV